MLTLLTETKAIEWILLFLKHQMTQYHYKSDRKCGNKSNRFIDKVKSPC